MSGNLVEERAFNFLTKILSLDSTQRNTQGLTIVALLRQIEFQIRMRLIPLAKRLLLNGVVLLEPINRRYEITIEKLNKLDQTQHLDEIGSDVWVCRVLSAFCETSDYESSDRERNMKLFSLWYASLTVMALGPSVGVKYNQETNTLSVRC